MLGQGIAPPIVESRGGNKVDGMFEIQNNADYPMATMLEVKSFSVGDEGLRFRPLDSGIQVKLGSSSFVLKAHDSRMVFYKATFPAAPVSFSIVTTMTKVGALEGVRINYVFPHIVYVYQKDKLKRTDVKVDQEDALLRVQNLSQKLGRVEAVDVNQEELRGFPLYPGQTRLVPVSDGTLSVKFEDGFTVVIR